MKNPLELVGYLVKSGEVREVVALELDDQLILLTNGGKKNTVREQNRDIEKARAFCDEFRSRVAAGAILTIIEP